jgi:hypothetical protein
MGGGAMKRRVIQLSGKMQLLNNHWQLIRPRWGTQAFWSSTRRHQWQKLKIKVRYENECGEWIENKGIYNNYKDAKLFVDACSSDAYAFCSAYNSCRDIKH